MSHTPTQARKRYQRSMALTGALYVLGVLGGAMLIDTSDPLTPYTLAVAFAPGLAIAFMLYAIWRFLKQTDEAARHFLTQSLFMACFVTLAVSGVWGLAELFLHDLPRLPVFYLFPLAMGLFGLLSCFGPARGFSRA